MDISGFTIIFTISLYQIYGPDGKVIHTADRESNGKYTFAAHMDGIYKYCFSNKMSTMTPKVVMFSMDIGEKPKDTNNMDTDGKENYLWVFFFCFFSFFPPTWKIDC